MYTHTCTHARMHAHTHTHTHTHTQVARLRVAQLEEALRHAEEDQHRLAREREEEGRRHEELQQLLHQQLSKSTLLKTTLDREVWRGVCVCVCVCVGGGGGGGGGGVYGSESSVMDVCVTRGN